jgi:hypothetical protein
MALIIDDCVVESTTTTGTGAITLAGAITGFKTFASRMADADVCYYLIEAIDGSGNRTGEWETGLGTYGSAGGTITRTSVHKSSNGDAAVNFSAGTKRIMICATATWLRHRGALVKKAADQTAANYTAGAVISWDNEGTGCYDTDGFHSTVTNTERLTVPAGVSKVRLWATVRVSSTADSWHLFTMQKNGSSDWVGCAQTLAEAGATAMYMSMQSAVVSVVAGDYFTVTFQSEVDNSITVEEEGSSFAIEVVE